MAPPDHCANIEALAARYPAMKIVGNRKTFSLMAQFYDFDVALREYEVKEGDRLPIGRRTLRFTFAPMVHWPEVMLTLEETEGVLFSADAFGAFGALRLCMRAGGWTRRGGITPISWAGTAGRCSGCWASWPERTSG